MISHHTRFVVMTTFIMTIRLSNFTLLNCDYRTQIFSLNSCSKAATDHQCSVIMNIMRTGEYVYKVPLHHIATHCSHGCDVMLNNAAVDMLSLSSMFLLQ